MSVISKKLMMAAGGGESYWIALLGGASVDQGWSVAVDSLSNIIVCGRTLSDGAGGFDLLVAKYDTLGTLLWAKTLGGASSDFGYGVAIDSSDNIIVCGSTYSDGAGDADHLVAKFNSSGVLQWDRTLGGAGTEVAEGVAVDSSNNVIFTGWSTTARAVGDAMVAKYNSSGTFQWDKRFSGASGDFGRGVAIDSSDNIIFCGSTASTTSSTIDCFVVKYNSSGTEQWYKILGGAGSDYFYGVAVDSSDNVITCGITNSDGAGNFDLLIAKYNSSGTLLWDRTLGGSGDDRGLGVAVDSSDNIIVCGYTASDGEGSNDILIAKYNSSGVLQWDKTLGGTGDDQALGVTVDALDNIIVCGYTASDGAGSYDFLVAKLPPDGSGDGTYGSLVYQDAVLTDEAAVLTDTGIGAISTSDITLTDAEAVLTDADAVLSEELFIVTP